MAITFKLADIRREMPELAGLPDDKLAKLVHQEFAADQPFDDFAKSIGYEKPTFFGGIGQAFSSGLRSTGRMLGAAGNTVTGDLADVEQYAADQSADQENKPEALRKFMGDVESRKKANPDAGVMSAIGDVLGAAWDNPEGAMQFVVEQTPNTMAVLGPAVGGALTGARFFPHPLGAIVGGVGGMFAGNTALETGGKAIEKADKGFTEEERLEALQEGPTKGGVITAVDVATLGLGGKVMKLIGTAARQAGEKAAAKTLMDAGVDVGDAAAVSRALANPKLAASAKAAGDQAAKATSTVANKVAQAGTGLTLETLGEGLGEYWGELAATGDANSHDAALEALAGLSQSFAEVAWNFNRVQGAELSPDGIVQAGQQIKPSAPKPNSPLTNAVNAAQAAQAAAAPRAAAPQTAAAPQAAQDAGPTIDPLAKRLALVESALNDGLLQQMREVPELGAQGTREFLQAYGIARNPNLDPRHRHQAMEQIESFLVQFANMPNFTMGGAEPVAEPSTALVPGVTPTGVGPVDPAAGSIPGQASRVPNPALPRPMLDGQSEASQPIVPMTEGETPDGVQVPVPPVTVKPSQAKKPPPPIVEQAKAFVVPNVTELRGTARTGAVLVNPETGETLDLGKNMAAFWIAKNAGAIHVGKTSPSAAAPAVEPQADTQAVAAGLAVDGPPVAPAAVADEFDVSGRTDAQLKVLTETGKPGWREAAIAEVARRSATPAPPVAAQGQNLGFDAPVDQLPESVEMVQQQAAAGVPAATAGASRPAPAAVDQSGGVTEMVSTPPAKKPYFADFLTLIGRKGISRADPDFEAVKAAYDQWDGTTPPAPLTEGQTPLVPSVPAAPAPVAAAPAPPAPSATPLADTAPGASPTAAEDAGGAAATPQEEFSRAFHEQTSGRFGSGAVETLSSAEKELRDLASDKPRAADDVRLGNGRYVPFSDALRYVREAVSAGVKPVPFQIHGKLDIAIGETDRLIAALNAPEKAATKPPAPSQPKPAAHATPAPDAAPQSPSPLDAELNDALAHLGDVLADIFPGNLKAGPGQHSAKDLLPALTKVVELLVRKGFSSFSAAVGNAAQAMRGNAATAPYVDQISARQWRAAYNSIGEFYPGTDNEASVNALTDDEVKAIAGVAPKAEIKSELDAKAHEAATSPLNDLPQPTEGQKEAGNYKVGKVRVHGLEVSIENPKGSYRTGVSPDGKAWSNLQHAHYGYFNGALASDGDNVDVYLADGAETAPMAWVIDQKNKDGSFDELKVILGPTTEADARAAYLANYEAGWDGIGAISSMPIEAFKAWIMDGKAKRKPLAYVEPDYKLFSQNTSTEATPKQFDSESWDKSRNEVVKASKKAGNKHLDQVTPSVETMRGKTIYYVHNPKQRGVIRTVDNRGNVYVDWADQYSADKELASEVEEDNKAWLKSSKNLPYFRVQRDGKTFVLRSSLGTSDLQDYVFGAGDATPEAQGTGQKPVQSDTAGEGVGREKLQEDRNFGDKPVSVRQFATSIEKAKTKNTWKIQGDPDALAEHARDIFGKGVTKRNDGITLVTKTEDVAGNFPVRFEDYVLSDLAPRYRDITVRVNQDGKASAYGKNVGYTTKLRPSVAEAIAEYRAGFADITQEESEQKIAVTKPESKWSAVDSEQDEIARNLLLERVATNTRDNEDLSEVLDRLIDPATREPYVGNVNRVAWAVMNNPVANESVKERAKKIYEVATRGVEDSPKLEEATEETRIDDIAERVGESDTLPPGKFTAAKTVVITKRGRKWFKANPEGKSYTIKVEINPASESFQVGEKRTFPAMVDVESTEYGTTMTVYPLSEAQAAKARRSAAVPEIERWLGFVEEKAPEGYVYQNGVDKLRALGIGEFPEYKARLDAALAQANAEKKRKSAAVVKERQEIKAEQQAQKRYLNVPFEEKDKARANGARWDANARRWYVIGEIPKALEQYAPAGARKLPEGHFSISVGEGYGGRPYVVGETIRNPKKDGPEFVTVLESSKQYFRDDGLSFGVGADQGHIFSAVVRAATAEESAPIHQAEEVARNKKDAKVELEQLANDMIKRGERPGGSNEVRGEVLANTQTLYGGGDWWVIQPDAIWYVRNNGADGDTWSANNVQTGGAGAIGWKVPFNDGLASRLRGLDEQAKTGQKYEPAIEEATERVAEKAPAAHVDQGEVEKATPAVVAEHVKDGAKAAGLSLKEQLNYLLGEIDKAIANVPTHEEAKDAERDYKRYKAEAANIKGKDGSSKAKRLIAEDNARKAAEQIGFVTFDVPGDGKFKVLNYTERLKDFRKAIEKNPGFKQARTPSSPKPTGASGSPETTIVDMLEDGELLAARELAEVRGKPFRYGDGLHRDGRKWAVLYPNAKPFTIEGREMFIGRAWNSKAKELDNTWSMNDLETGLRFVDEWTEKAVIAKAEKFVKEHPGKLAAGVEAAKAEGRARTQEDLAADWEQWAEQQEGALKETAPEVSKPDEVEKETSQAPAKAEEKPVEAQPAEAAVVEPEKAEDPDTAAALDAANILRKGSLGDAGLKFDRDTRQVRRGEALVATLDAGVPFTKENVFKALVAVSGWTPPLDEIQVTAPVWDTDNNEYVLVDDLPADQALAAIDKDISTLKGLLECLSL